jgi:hypothetical protein
MSNYIIEKNIPVPAITRRGRYPFDVMEIGDSFVFSADHRKSISASASIAGGKLRRSGKNVRFVIRAVPNTNRQMYRVWCVSKD